MYCKKCGNSIGTNEKCPFCGTEQQNFDPFTTLGDIEPNKSYGRTKDYVNDPAIPSTKSDCFSSLGDLEQSGGCFGEVYDTSTDTVINSIDPFQSIGNLDGSPTFLDDSDMDAPATGGFKPMGELVPPNNGQAETEETENRNPTVTFVWKKWMTVAASVVAVIIAVLLFDLSPSENAYEIAISEKITSEMIQGKELPLAYQYNNAVLNAIDFQLLDTDKSMNIATVRFTYVDVLSLADRYVGNMDDPGLFYTDCIDQIMSGSAPTSTKTISVSFAVFESGGPKKLVVLDSADLADVLTGGVASEYAKLSGGD